MPILFLQFLGANGMHEAIGIVSTVVQIDLEDCLSTIV